MILDNPLWVCFFCSFCYFCLCLLHARKHIQTQKHGFFSMLRNTEFHAFSNRPGDTHGLHNQCTNLHSVFALALGGPVHCVGGRGTTLEQRLWESKVLFHSTGNITWDITQTVPGERHWGLETLLFPIPSPCRQTHHPEVPMKPSYKDSWVKKTWEYELLLKTNFVLHFPLFSFALGLKISGSNLWQTKELKVIRFNYHTTGKYTCMPTVTGRAGNDLCSRTMSVSKLFSLLYLENYEVLD